MATTTKRGRGKTTVGPKARSKTEIKSRGGPQTKIGKPASKPRNKKVKALGGADKSGGAGLASSVAHTLPLPGPPTIDSAVGIADRTIRLSWRYNYYPLGKFSFQRKNLTLKTTAQFDVHVDPPNTPPSAQHYTFDDIGGGTILTRLDPQTSYEYRVAALVEPGLFSPLSDPVIGTTPNTPFEPTFEALLLNDEGGWEGYCLVQRIGRLKQSGTQVQLTLRASSVSAAFIDRIYISQPDPAGDNPYDSADDLIEVNPKFEIPAGQALTLPWVRYILDVGQPLLIAVDFSTSPPAPPSGIRWRPAKMHGGPPGQPVFFSAGVGYWRAGAEAALRNRSANYVPEDRIYLIEKIAVR
jgi:hypothetical protein